MSRHEHLQIRVTDVEKAKIRERAIAAGKNVSDYVRDRALCVPVSAIAANRPVHAGQTSVDEQVVASEIAEPIVDDIAREAFLERRTKQLHGQGKTMRLARRAAEAEWESRAS